MKVCGLIHPTSGPSICAPIDLNQLSTLTQVQCASLPYLYWNTVPTTHICQWPTLCSEITTAAGCTMAMPGLYILQGAPLCSWNGTQCLSVNAIYASGTVTS